MKSKHVILLLVLAIIALAIFAFNQQKSVKNLKSIHAKYDVLSTKFKDLYVNYQSSLDEYQKLKVKLDLNRQRLDSLSKILVLRNNGNTAELTAASLEITNAINAIDTSSFHFSPTVNLDSLFQ